MGRKTAIIIRHGGYGDVVMALSVIPYLKDDGYTIDFYTNQKGAGVVHAHSKIRKIMLHDETIPMNDLEEHWERVGEPYDKVVNLHDLIENKVLFAYPQPEYFWPMKKRREKVGDTSCTELHIKRAGYEIDRSTEGTIYFTKSERKKAKAWQEKYKGMFKVVWAMSGSSVHKAYRFFEPAAKTFLSLHEDAHLFTAGDYTTKLLTFNWPRVANTMFWEMPYRDAMLMTAHADLFIGPETGLANVAGCFRTPKIVLLTHSGKNQLTKYYSNDYSFNAPTWCSPCHLLHKYKYIWRYKCQMNPTLESPMCCEHGKGDLLDRMEEVYGRWKSSRKENTISGRKGGKVRHADFRPRSIDNHPSIQAH